MKLKILHNIQVADKEVCKKHHSFKAGSIVSVADLYIAKSLLDGCHAEEEKEPVKDNTKMKKPAKNKMMPPVLNKGSAK